MGIQLTKDSIDLGIVVTDAAKALAFYRDTLGFRYEGEMPMGGGSIMHRLLCGTSLIKVIAPATIPEAKAAPGGIQGGTGYRYWTISVSNIQELTDSCAAKGYKVLRAQLSFQVVRRRGDRRGMLRPRQAGT